jgi:fumarylacetoacetate (FAA) hydrolase
MKLASLISGGRDGTLIIVNRDFSKAVIASDIAPTLQAALERWSEVEPQLMERYAALNGGNIAGVFPFDEHQVHSPLPRSYQWCEASVYISHLERCRKATGRDMPASLYTEIGMHQGGSDSFCPPRGPLFCPRDDWDVDVEAGVCVITDDVPMGVSEAEAADHIKLVFLVNDFSLRRIQYPEMAKGMGVLQSKPANSYSPVAVTPAGLGNAWTGRMLAGRVCLTVRGELIGSPYADRDALFDFPQLIAFLAMTREIEAGSIIGAGTVSNRDPALGQCCLSEKRAVEILDEGLARTPFLSFGDRIRIEAVDADGASLFGAIDQVVSPNQRPAVNA